jgi:hypothetical protein
MTYPEPRHGTSHPTALLNERDWRRGFAARATALPRYRQANQNPAARQAGRPSAGHKETANHSPPPRCADSRRGSRLHTPDTSTANRPSSFSLHGRSPIGARPCGLPSGEDGFGEGKAESLPWRGPAGEARHTGATIPLWERKGKARGCSRLDKDGGDQPPSAATRHRQRHPCSGATPPDALRAGLWASGRPASREARVPAGQSENAAPSRSEAGKSATLKTPAQPTPLQIVTGIGQDYRLGLRSE